MIGDEPMIVHVWRRGLEADLGPVVIASGDPQIARAVRDRGGLAIDTDPNLPSGSDRVAAALEEFDRSSSFDIVVNLQGDMPTANPEIFRQGVRVLANLQFDLSTLACPITSEEELAATSVVKVAMEPLGDDASVGRAMYFSRAPIPHGASSHLHHIGLYVYRREALRRYVAAPPSALELTERLEQLRALSMGLAIGVKIVDTNPLGVDTVVDLEKARSLLS